MGFIRNCKNKQFLFVFLLLGLMGNLWAQELKPLYEVELPTQKEGWALDQPVLLEAALKRVLIQVCGSNTVLKSPAVTTALQQPDKYVSKISYHHLAASASSNGTDPTQIIKILFNESKINQLLKSANKLVWEKQRPLTLIWCVIDQGEGIHWLGVGGEEDLPWVEEMTENLTSRAIPYLFPLLDLTETTQVSEQDILNELLEPIKQNSERYHPDVILLGRIGLKDKIWQGHWTLMGTRENISWESSGEELKAVLNQMAEGLAVKLSGQEILVQTAAPITSHKLTVAITGIMNAEQYSRILEYLSHLSSVTKVEVAEVMSDKTLFSVYTTHDKEKIAADILQGNYLMENPSHIDNEIDTLSYRLRGG